MNLNKDTLSFENSGNLSSDSLYHLAHAPRTCRLFFRLLGFNLKRIGQNASWRMMKARVGCWRRIIAISQWSHGLVIGLLAHVGQGKHWSFGLLNLGLFLEGGNARFYDTRD